MAERTRRAGCGCASLLFLLFLLGSAFSAALAWGEGNRLAGLVAVGAGALILAGLLLALVVRARRSREEAAAPPSPVSPPSRPHPRPVSTLERSEREVRSGPRRLTTQPESEEAQALKQRLTEAVADLADTVEEMPQRTDRGPARRMTSDEMIARAKRRIHEQAENPEI